MAAHTLLSIKNALVSIDAVEFGDAITEATVAVTYDTSEFVPISGATQSGVGPLKHVLNLNFGQSLVNGELLHTLYTRHGENVPFSIRPEGGTTPAVAGVLTITAPAAIGGSVGVATTSAALPIKGKPTITWAAATEPAPED